MAKSLEAQAQAAINKAMDIHPTVVYVGSNPSGSIKVWIVAGHAGDYAVYEECGVMHCTCEAGQRGIVCYHRGAVLIHKLEREAYEAFSKALDQSIAERARMDEEEDAALACAVGAWFLDQQAKKAAPVVATKRQMCFYCDHYFDMPVADIEAGKKPVCQSNYCQKEQQKDQARKESAQRGLMLQEQRRAALAEMDAAEQRINAGAHQRMVERIREADHIMGRHTELGPTLKGFDYVEADKATALPANDLGFYFENGLPLKAS